nr:LacI family DNA-binding transcriptional regulator [Actinopolymorpha pittospori]
MSSGPRASRRRPTLRDVARIAGVDLSTASRLLRHHTAGYRPETVERVLRAAAELGYRPNSQARALRLQRQQALAMLVPDLDNFGFTGVLRGVQETCLERGFTLLVSEVRSGPDLPPTDLSILEGRIDGALVAFATVDDPRFEEWLRQLEVPTVFVQRGSPQADASVVLDEERNAALMVEHLASLGHRRIGHVCGSLRTDTGLRRQRGFDDAMAARRLSVRAQWCVDGGFTFDGGHAATLSIMNRAARGRPTALAVDGLVSALGALSALRELGLSVPADVSILSIDEHVVAQQTMPPLTTVKVPQRELGNRAAQMLIDIIEGGVGDQVVIDASPRIVVRESTAPPTGARSRWRD